MLGYYKGIQEICFLTNFIPIYLSWFIPFNLLHEQKIKDKDKVSNILPVIWSQHDSSHEAIFFYVIISPLYADKCDFFFTSFILIYLEVRILNILILN